jgi:hypothetical protein
VLCFLKYFYENTKDFVFDQLCYHFRIWIRGVHGLDKPTRSGQTHPIQPKKVGWVGQAGDMDFKNEKLIKKFGFRVKPTIQPNPTRKIMCLPNPAQ